MSNAQSTDEKDIIDYLKCSLYNFVAGREIARKAAGRQRYEEDHGWAIPVLMQMVRLGIIETDHLGGYRLKTEQKKKKLNRHVSPQMLNILKSSGKSFDGIEIDDPEANPENNSKAPPSIPVYRKPPEPTTK